jgi:hypothetical protein
MKLHTDLSWFHSRIMGNAIPHESRFFEDKKFAEKQYDAINEKLLQSTKKKQHTAVDTSNILHFFEHYRFSNEEKASLHENFFWSFDCTINHIDQMMISLRAQAYDEQELMHYIKELFEDIHLHHAERLFPSFEKIRHMLFENPDIASFKAAIDKAFPDINLKSGNRQTLDFLASPTHFENYKSIFFLYKIREAALIIFHYDRRQEDQIDGYLKHVNQPADDLKREEKKDILCNRIDKTLQDFITYFLQTRASIEITSPEIKKHLMSTSVKLQSSFRFKTEASKIRKTLLRKEYPNQIYDYTGAYFLIHLPELEELLTQPHPQKLHEHIKQTIFTLKYDIAQELIAYLPSLLGNYADSKTRVRAYLGTGNTPADSSKDYQALHFSFFKFVVDDYPFDIPLEFQLVLDYGSHETMRINQFERLSETYYQQATMEQVVREEVKYQIDPSKENYITYSKYNTKALNPYKLQQKEYIDEMQDMFRRQNAHTHVVDLYTKCNVYLFQQLFSYDKAIFDRKVTGLSDEQIIRMFGKNKLHFVKSQIPTFALRILQREYDYIIKPLQEKLEILANNKHTPKSKVDSSVNKVRASAQTKLTILKEYVAKIKEQYPIQTR